MSVITELAEARATALVLRATARATRAEQDALRFRLNRAADTLDSVVALAARCLERIEELERQLRQLGGGQ